MEYCSFCCDHTVCGELDWYNDYSAITLTGSNGKRLMFCSGNGLKPRFELDELFPDDLMHTTMRYFPRFCPNCGRFLYDNEEDNNAKI